VRVFAAGAISSDLSYVVMELLRGQTLRDELNARGRLPITEAVAVAIEVAAGLSVVHARGIVHRDLTPRNIFLCEEIADCGLQLTDSTPRNNGLISNHNHNPQSAIRNPQSAIVKLIDFGIAKFPKQPGAQTYTQHAVMAGTPGYASPEQFQNLTVDHRADIYSLGVVLYEMVTGEKPFVGRSATEIAVKQLRDEPARPRTLVPELPLRLEALILRALAKDPAVRQQSAEELLAELKTIAARVEVPLAAPVVAPAAFALAADPSGSQVFTLLSDLVAKDEEKPTAPERLTGNAAVVPSEPLPEITFSYPQPRRHRALLVAACLAFLFVMGTWAMWLVKGRPSASSQTALPAPSASTQAQPTPTLRPDVTAPRTNARTNVVRQPAGENNSSVEKAEREEKSEKVLATATTAKPHKTSAASVPASNLPAPTPQPTTTPAVAAARIPAPPIHPPSIKVEPTPSPAPAPAREETARSTNDSDGWHREPSRPLPSRPAESAPPRPTSSPLVMEPKIFPWRGPVFGSREIILEMPGVPGMVDIPRDYRKRVGVVEPPSPSNGWRRVVLRVFGNGDVSLIVRWLPHRELHKQELVQKE
jgi:serine/threonine-protein kinase